MIFCRVFVSGHQCIGQIKENHRRPHRAPVLNDMCVQNMPQSHQTKNHNRCPQPKASVFMKNWDKADAGACVHAIVEPPLGMGNHTPVRQRVQPKHPAQISKQLHRILISSKHMALRIPPVPGLRPVRTPGVAQSVLDMVPLYLSEGEAEGVRGDVAFAQSCLETGNFMFSGLDTQPLHIRRTPPCNKLKARIHIPIHQILRTGIGFQMLYLAGLFTGVGVFTVVEEADGKGAGKWGLLKSYKRERNGWISLDFVTRL